MELKYITYSERLRQSLSDIGFNRKNRNDFVRKYNDVIQTLSFCHSARIPHRRDYYIIVSITSPEVGKIAEGLDIFWAGEWGVTIGQLSPKNNFQEWQILNSATENEIKDIVDDMVYHINTDAVPFLNEYSTIGGLINGIEKGNRIISYHSNYNLPILYWLNGEKEEAIRYLKWQLERNQEVSGVNVRGNSENKETFIPSSERERINYNQFAKQFMEWMGERDESHTCVAGA